jgi:hypothetical protein
MDTPSTDRAIAWIRTMRMLGADEGARIADEFLAMRPHVRTAAVHGFLREIERFTFGPDPSRIGQAAAERLGEQAWAELQRAVHAVRDAVAVEMRAAQQAEDERVGRGAPGDDDGNHEPDRATGDEPGPHDGGNGSGSSGG